MRETKEEFSRIKANYRTRRPATEPVGRYLWNEKGVWERGSADEIKVGFSRRSSVFSHHTTPLLVTQQHE